MLQQRYNRILPRTALILSVLSGLSIGAGCERGEAPLASPAFPPQPVAPQPRSASGSAPRAVPVLEQVGVGCIPYSAAAVAQYHGIALDPLELLRSLPVGPRGVAWTDVVAELRRRGIEARMIEVDVAELRAYLRAGRPLVIAQSRGVAGDHALVAIAYDPATARYAVMDPAEPALRSLDGSELEAAWEVAFRRTLLVEPP